MKTLLDGAAWKTPTTILVSLIMFNEFEWLLIITLMVWLWLDTITGVAASLKVRKEALSSEKMFCFATKSFVYFGGAVGVKTLARVIPSVEGYAFSGFMSWFILTEIKSFIENTSALGINMPKGIFKKIFDYLGKIK